MIKDTSVTAGIRTHILLLTPELEPGKLDRSATTLHNNNNNNTNHLYSALTQEGTTALYNITSNDKLNTINKIQCWGVGVFVWLVVFPSKYHFFTLLLKVGLTLET